MKKAAFVGVYVNSAGDIEAVEATRAEVSVTLSDGQVLELHAFTGEILKYWKRYLIALAIKVRRQSLAQLAGA